MRRIEIRCARGASIALEAANPGDISLLFNIGLCHEGEGNLEAAADHYQSVLRIKPGKLEAVQGLDRIASRLRAERQLEMHEARTPA